MGTKRTKLALSEDKNLTAMGKGERTSKKVSTIKKADGTSFKRVNANQYVDAGNAGGNDYSENRINRTDVYHKDKRKKVFELGGNIEKIKAYYVGEDDWSRKLYKTKKGNLYADIDDNGVLYSLTSEGEPISPARNIEIAEDFAKGGNIEGFNYEIGGL